MLLVTTTLRSQMQRVCGVAVGCGMQVVGCMLWRQRQRQRQRQPHLVFASKTKVAKLSMTVSVNEHLR